LKLIVVHYHLRPGGVRRVIELAVPHIMERMGEESPSVLLATGGAPDSAWLAAFRRRLAPMPVVVRTLPSLAYFSEQQTSGADLRKKIHADLRSLFAKADAGDSVVWAHNLGLGRNLLLTRELIQICTARGLPLLLHQHDWWFDNRWQRWPELRRCGFRTMKAVAQAVLPVAGNVVYVTINREDTRILQKHFHGRAHWLPNIAEPASSPSPARLRFARRWLRTRLGSAAPVWLLPCRLLRRKNIGEALLLTRWLRPEAWLVTTGGASSADEQAYAEKLASSARAHRWPLRLGILTRDGPNTPDVTELMAASEAVLLTSIQEGFGLPNLEAAAAARPLLARRLPNIAPDLAELGFRFPQSYDEILTDPRLFDWEGETRRQETLFRAWLLRLPRGLRKLAGVPALLARRKPHPVPFSRLTLTAQLEVLGYSPKESWKLCAPLNPFLHVWKQRAATGRLQVTPWPRSATKRLGGAAYAKRFEEMVHGDTQDAGKPAASLAAQAEFIRARLDSAHLFPLLWAPCT
jgi:hypothetical protein